MYKTYLTIASCSLVIASFYFLSSSPIYAQQSNYPAPIFGNYPREKPSSLDSAKSWLKPDWIDGWEFLGLTRTEVKQKIDDWNGRFKKSQKVPILVNADITEFKVNSNPVAHYSLDYVEDKVCRFRTKCLTNYRCVSPVETDWIEDRKKALSEALLRYENLLDQEHFDLEWYLLSDAYKSDNRRKRMLVIEPKLRMLRDLYSKRFELKGVAGISNVDQVFQKKFDGMIQRLNLKN